MTLQEHLRLKAQEEKDRKAALSRGEPVSDTPAWLGREMAMMGQ